MFNIIKTPRNYFTCELLDDNFGSNVAFHCNISHWRSYFEVSCSEEVFCWPSTAPVRSTSQENKACLCILFADGLPSTELGSLVNITNISYYCFSRYRYS